MTKLAAIFLGLACGTLTWGQTSAGIARSIAWGATLPAACAPAGIPNVFFKTSATVGTYQCTATNTWSAMGATGTVTSVGLAGTASQITVTGATPITGSGSWTLSIPTSPTLPGTTTGTFSGNLTGTASGNLTPAQAPLTLGIVIDGGGTTIGTGSKGYATVPVACTLASATLTADQSGSIVIDVKRSTYSGFPTTTSLCSGGTCPTLSSAQKSTTSSLTSWTVSLSAGDWLEYNVNSATSVQRVTLALGCTR